MLPFSSVWNKAWVQFWCQCPPRPTSWWYRCYCHRAVCCCYPWAVFQHYLVMSCSLPCIFLLSQHITLPQCAKVLKSPWEAVVLPLHDCGPFGLDKPTVKYFLKTLWGREYPPPFLGEDQEGSWPEELGVSHLHCLVFWVLVGFQFYYSYLKKKLNFWSCWFWPDATSFLHIISFVSVLQILTFDIPVFIV